MIDQAQYYSQQGPLGSQQPPPQSTLQQQQNSMGPQQQQQPPPPQQVMQSSRGEPQVMQPSAPPLGSGGHQSRQAAYQQQQAAAAAGYGLGSSVDMGGQGYSGPMAPPARLNGTSSHHQAPLAPPSSGHHGRYSSGGHRSALHQHRSSAAAISDPMMAGTITDQLASASGPLTGSGSALNQLGATAGYGPTGYYDAGGGYPAPYRDPAHYPTSSSRRYHHQSQQLLDGSLSSHHQHHLGHQQAGYGAHYTQQQHHHQSLGNLPGALSSTRGGYAMDPQERYFGTGAGDGLGAYNPLDDPLAPSTMVPTASGAHHHHHHQQQASYGGGQMYGAQYPQGSGGGGRDLYVTELRARLQELQNSYAQVKRELETATQKLGSSMHSIKSFWSPELKKERALRKEEATKFALVNDQMKLMRVEVQKQALLIRQLEEELRLAHETRIRIGDPDVQQHIDALCVEKESLFKENCLLRETARELEMRVETQKQTLAARDDSIRKMVEMMNNKGIATKLMEDERLEMDRIKTRNIELEARLRHYEQIIEQKEKDIIKFNDSTGELEQTNLLPSSPTPKQRKSLQATANNRKCLSRSERLKSRLKGSSAQIHNLQDQSTTSSSLSSSSGLGSISSASLAPMESTGSEKLQHPPTMKLEFKLCQCNDCLRSGQEIYQPTSVAPLHRKQVSFRSSVEHIGSPQVKLSNSFVGAQDISHDDDYLRPIDCSTPQVNLMGEQLVRAEVHQAPQNQAITQIGAITCLCAPDFLCTHNRLMEASNELYGNLGDLVLEPRSAANCLDCSQLSTYANLSVQTGSANDMSIANGNQQQHHNGYATGDYRRLLLQEQQQQQDQGYLRRLQQTLDNCDMCKRQLEQLQCSCDNDNSKPETSNLSSTNSAAYQSARSNHSSGDLMLQNASQLSVLPAQLATEATARPINNNNNGNDSSLSSLFVYRHTSDDNQMEQDSLEATRPAKGKPNSTSASSSSNWLKARPKSEYVSLSSTTSSGSLNANSRRAKGSNKTSGKTTTAPQQPIQADLTQSVIARRRHQKAKANLVAPGSNGDISLSTSSNANTKKSANGSSKSSLGRAKSSPNISASGAQEKVHKSIYQSFKSHLLEMRGAGRKSGGSQVGQIGKATGVSATLPRSLHTSGHNNNTKMEELRGEVAKREQELMTMAAKLKAQEEQLRDSARHIMVLKDSLAAKEEHYNLLLADVEELRRNLDERNKLIERKSYQQTGYGGQIGGGKMMNQRGFNQIGANYQELEELQAMLEARDKRIMELQRRLGQIEERQQSRMALGGGGGHGSNQRDNADSALLGHLEESLGDREKQIALIREQRDRAEHELQEERDSHERSIKEYKMKLSSLKFELDKLQSRLGKSTDNSKSFQLSDGLMDSSSASSYKLQDQIKRLELDKRGLQLECERLRDRLESQRRIGGASGGELRSSSALGADSGASNLQEIERLQEQAESLRQELRRAQAEWRMSEMERKRAQEEADKLNERCERSQAELVKVRARLENAQAEREQLLEEQEFGRQQLSKAQTELGAAQQEVQSLRGELERQQQQANRWQLQSERLEAQLERAQLEQRRLEERQVNSSDEMRRYQSERQAKEREIKSLELALEEAKQERELAQVGSEKGRERIERLEAELSRQLEASAEHQQQAALWRERCEQQQNQGQKWVKERERLQSQLEKQSQDLVAMERERQSALEKVQRTQTEAVAAAARLEQCELERDKLAMELEKAQGGVQRLREDQRRQQEELEQLREMYTKTSSKLLKLVETEERLRIEQDKGQMDLEVLRERHEKLQAEARRLQAERDRLQVDALAYKRQRGEAQSGGQAGRDELARLQAELERAQQRVEQYQRELNKLQLEKERLLLDFKAQLQQQEQQREALGAKLRAGEEKWQVEVERLRLQLDKAASRCEQQAQEQERLGADKERLQQQLLLLQQEVDKFRSQQSSSMQETKRLHDEELQRLVQELEATREKYQQQRKELLQLRELQQGHQLEQDLLRRELQQAEQRLDRLNQSDVQRKEEADRCLLEVEKMRDRAERKQQELVRAQKERNQFAQEIQLLHQQLQQLQTKLQESVAQGQAQGQTQAAPATQQQQQQQQPQNAQQQQQQQQEKVATASKEEVGRLKQMLLKSEAELQKSMAENQRFQMEVERLKLQLDDAAEYVGKIESDNSQLQKQCQELVEQLKVLAANSKHQHQQQQQQQPQLQEEQVKKMQDVIKKSSLELQKMQEERQRVEEANKGLQRQLDQTRQEFAKVMEQSQKETRAETEKQESEYKAKFEKAVEAIRAFQKSSDDMKREIIKLNERNKSLAEQNAGLVQSLQRADGSTSNTSKPEHLNQLEELKKLQEASQRLEAELRRAQEETQKAAKANEQLSEQLQGSSGELTKIKQERDRCQAQVEKLITELERVQAESINLRQQQDKSGQGVQAKQQELAQYQRQLEERERVLEAKRQELAKSQQNPGNNQHQQELVARLQQQVQALEEERNKLRGELERVRQELRQKEQELERLLKILTASEEDKFNLSQQIEQLQSRLKSMPAPGPQSVGQVPARGAPAGPQQQQATSRGPPPKPQVGGPARASQQPHPQQQQQQQQQQLQQKPAQQQQPQQQQQQQIAKFKFQDQMELLELALKQSLAWLLRAHQRDRDDDGFGVELTIAAPDNNQERAFISHFKVELNKLIAAATSAGSTTDWSEESCAEELPVSGGQKWNKRKAAAIKINGSHCGLYKINGNEEGEGEEDDGYRSLSRGSLRERSQILEEQLNLVAELGHLAERRLFGLELKCFLEKRDLLVRRLELWLAPLPAGELASKWASRNEQEGVDEGSEYEEQVQVIDYRRHRHHQAKEGATKSEASESRATLAMPQVDSMATTTTSTTTSFESTLRLTRTMQPIDFGQLMRRHEEAQDEVAHRGEVVASHNSSAHSTISSNSNSTYSSSSHASSSSSFL